MMTDTTSAMGYRASREAAADMLGDGAALRSLLASVEVRQQLLGPDLATRMHLDIAEAIVDAHIEELNESGLTPAAAQRLRTDAQCLLVVAALHYIATRPCSQLSGEPEDLEILQWVTGLTPSDSSVS